MGKLPCLEISQVCFLCTDYGGPSGETAVSRDFTGLFSMYGFTGAQMGKLLCLEISQVCFCVACGA